MADSQANPVKPAIVMKVDSPLEENAKQENEENENTEKNISEIKPTQICSPASSKPILLQSRLGSNPFAATNTFSNSILRPSQLGSKSNIGTTKSTFALNPSRLNPLTKITEDTNSDNNDSTNKKPNLPQSNGDATPKFVPLLQTDKKPNEPPIKPVTTTPTNLNSSSSNFVFGQNLQDRVLSDSKTDDPRPSTSCLNSNGTTEMLFSSALKEKTSEIPVSSVNKENKSLSESAKEYEESRANKRKYEEVEVKTGEEDETNILQISCKLFFYDKATGNWKERGRGNLRLNDLEVSDGSSTYTQSRLVFRTSGSLRVVLNTKIWAEMTVEQASTKSIRFTAYESNGEIKVYLIMANQEEIKQLYKQLEERLKNEKSKQYNSASSGENCLKKQATDSGGK